MNARLRRRGGSGAGVSAGASSRKWGKSGKIAAGSVMATVVGAVVRDLSRPNSVIRGLISVVRQKLLKRRESRTAIDLGEAVEVKIADDRTTKHELEDNNNNQQEV